LLWQKDRGLTGVAAVITKLDHPKFGIEKLVAKWEKDLAQTAPASLSVTICNTACSLCMSHGLATRFRDLVDAPWSLLRLFVRTYDGLCIEVTIRSELLVDLFRDVGLPVTSTVRFLVLQLAVSS
jgi:hypothetical protein